jgi:murein DD-endopeptidase MepM/ murein hydrolase activator NlpD
MAGALALVLAGAGTTLASNRADVGALHTEYQAISASYTGSTAEGDVDISRDFDRNLDEQARQQAAQRDKALAELASAVGARAQQLKSQWVLPVTGYRLTARFGQAGGMWSTGFHTGLDFAGPAGTTIVSVAAGVVVSVGYEGAYGNRTVIRLADGTEIWYCHQSRIVVRVGTRVGPSDVIGFTGSTGNVSGPHLHLEVHPHGGRAVDPYTALIQHGVRP